MRVVDNRDLSKTASAAAEVACNCPERQHLSIKVLEERVVHARYLTLFERTVQFSNSATLQHAEHTYDIVGHPLSEYQFAVVFAYHPATGGQKGGEVTVIREYAQGPNSMMYCLPTGGFDPHRHHNIQGCARAELSEEAQLCGGKFVRLLPPGHPGFAEVKWCKNRFVPFLVIDPQLDHTPGSRDAEEVIEICRITIDELRELLVSGDMLLPSITTSYIALQHLNLLGYV